MKDQKNIPSTFDEESPVFKSWSTWYILVIIVNILGIGLIQLLISLI